MNEILLAGILISLLYTEFTGLSPGGVIVPAYFALFLHAPWRMAATVILAFCTWGVIRLLSCVTILYGRRRFALFLITGILVKLLASFLYRQNLLPLADLSASIGYLVPGLLARDTERQGILPTYLSLGIVLLMIYLVVTVVGGGVG